jgi:hypothetical protein
MDSYLQRLRSELEQSTAGASADVMAQAPPGKWSADQILEHLLLTYRNTARSLEKCLARGVPLATRASFKERFASLLVVGLGYLPTGRNSPERVTPRGTNPEEVRCKIWEELDKMDAGLEKCASQFGVRTKLMNHPFLGPLTVDQWRKFHWIHGRHHARQIRERIQES